MPIADCLIDYFHVLACNMTKLFFDIMHIINNSFTLQC